MPRGGWLTVSTRAGRRKRDRRGRGHRVRHSAGAARAHLRSVLHDEGHRPRNRARACRSRTGSSASTTAPSAATAPVGQGTRFTLALPVCVQPALEAAAPGTDSPPQSHIMATTRKGTILVVDDEEIMREILETLLTREGYEVKLASSGEEGLELARALPFDAAVVDIMMPGINGIETLDELRRIDEDLAVIIITAYASVESAISAMKSGAFDYITKPFKNEEVLVVIRNAMERRRLVHENRNLRQNIQERYHKFGEHHRPQSEDAAGVRPDHPGGAEPVEHPDPGRERDRQGAGRARHSRELVAIRAAVRGGEFRQRQPGAARVVALRARAGRVRGSGLPEEGALRPRRSRLRSSSTRSATCRSTRSRSSCASSRSASSPGSAASTR